MSDADPLPTPLESLLDRLAREDLAGVLEDARTTARERVRAHLTDELARRMLASLGAGAAAHEPQAAPPPTVGSPEPREETTAARPAARTPEAAPPGEASGGAGVYVYAVVAPEDGDVRLARGIGDVPVRILESRDTELRALVSDVPLDEFGDEALKRNLNDLAWVSATALAHEAVVERAMSGATLVPMRMCTIFRDEDGVREMLRREAPGLHAALARLRGAHEWGVKVVVDGEAFAAAVARESGTVGELRDAAPATGEGAGYFAALRHDRATREEVAARLERRTREIHEAVGALAADSRLHPPSNRELSGYEGDMVLNGAYLVAGERTEELRALAASLADRYRGEGLTVELTGPWPPYNFSMLAGGL